MIQKHDRTTSRDGVTYVGCGVRFERIRRITGYLVGTLDRFNNAKRCEERDRVTHVGATSLAGRRLTK